jgi:hypothetical protein
MFFDCLLSDFCQKLRLLVRVFCLWKKRKANVRTNWRLNDDDINRNVGGREIRRTIWRKEGDSIGEGLQAPEAPIIRSVVLLVGNWSRKGCNRGPPHRHLLPRGRNHLPPSCAPGVIIIIVTLRRRCRHFRRCPRRFRRCPRRRCRHFRRCPRPPLCLVRLIAMLSSLSLPVIIVVDSDLCLTGNTRRASTTFRSDLVDDDSVVPSEDVGVYPVIPSGLLL